MEQPKLMNIPVVLNEKSGSNVKRIVVHLPEIIDMLATAKKDVLIGCGPFNGILNILPFNSIHYKPNVNAFPEYPSPDYLYIP